MANVNFDDFEEQETETVASKPLWTIKLDDPQNEDNILKWLNKEIAHLKEEDLDMCESVQRGIASPGYDFGRYAPDWEKGALQFHRLLAAGLRAEAPVC